MENNRIKRYQDGDSISSIAKDEGVSRQAVIDYLKRSGAYKSKSSMTKPRPISQKVMTRISGFVQSEVKGEASLGDNVFWKKGSGFYWKKWVGMDKPLEDIPLPELNDTFS